MTNPAHLAGNEPDLDHNDETIAAAAKLHETLAYIEKWSGKLYERADRMDTLARYGEAHSHWPAVLETARKAAEESLHALQAAYLDMERVV